MLLWIQQQQLQQHIFYKVIFSSVFSFFPCQKEQFFLPEVGRLRPPHEIGSQQGREDFVSQVQQVKVPKIPGIGKVVRVLQALKAEQDVAAEAACAVMTAVVAGNVS